MDVNDVTQEQLDVLEQKVGTLEKEKGESTSKLEEFVKAKEEWQAKEKEYQEQVNPNWQIARRKIDKLQAIVKEKGIEVDEEGNIKSNSNNVSIEQIRQEASNAAKNELLGSKLEDMLSIYDSESSEIVRHFYSKVTQGEQVTLQNIQKFINQAQAAAEIETGNKINKIKQAVNYSGGQGPRQPNENELDDSRAKELGQKFGLPFARDQK